MHNNKLTPEEIQALRENAEKERATHAEVMANIRRVIMSPDLQMSTIKSSYERNREDEILALLRNHVPSNKQYELSTEVKLFIYDDSHNLKEAKAFLLQKNLLGYELEKRIFDDKLQPFYKKDSSQYTQLVYPKFCPNAEVYMVEKTLEACKKADKLNGELDFLLEYIETYPLSPSGETALMDFLYVNTGRDSVLDTLESTVITYMGHHDCITPAAQLRIIQSGNHKVIMHCILHTVHGIQDPEVLDALLERAEPEEVKAYFARWARLSV